LCLKSFFFFFCDCMHKKCKNPPEKAFHRSEFYWVEKPSHFNYKKLWGETFLITGFLFCILCECVGDVREGKAKPFLCVILWHFGWMNIRRRSRAVMRNNAERLKRSKSSV
jgi:hypothetical protein